MVKSQELIYCFVICIALISLSRCGSFVTVTEDEDVNLKFPYPCESNRVTIQSANRLPFYISAKPNYLDLPFYQLNRFSVTDKNCSFRVNINPVKRIDEATYICKAYKDDVIQGRFTKIRLNVNYPPGEVACTFSIDDDVVGDWVPLQCTAPAGSLAGGIYCYQDSKRLPPQSNLIKTGTKLEQTIWARKEYPVYCCSSILDRPKERCECNDFVWNPFDTEKILNPCPVTTAGQGAIIKGPVEKGGDHLFTDILNPSTSKKQFPQISETILILLGGTFLLFSLISFFYYEHTEKIIVTKNKEGHLETLSFMTKVQEYGFQTSQKVPPVRSNTDKAISRSSSWGYLSTIDIGGIFPLNGQLKAKSTGTLHL